METTVWGVLNAFNTVTPHFVGKPLPCHSFCRMNRFSSAQARLDFKISGIEKLATKKQIKLGTKFTSKKCWGPSRISAVSKSLESLANVRIPRTLSSGDNGRPILAYIALPPALQETAVKEQDGKGDKKLPLLIVLHEFWGLKDEICGKAQALSEELNCAVIAPDTYRGETTDFIPKAIYLALSTPQERVNEDLNEVLSFAATLDAIDMDCVAIIGFCYGGGKAIRFSADYKKAKATVVCYGSPFLDGDQLKQMEGTVLGIYGDRDNQFPVEKVKQFKNALDDAGVKNTISIYENQGHAFWSNMAEVDQDGPQRRAWREIIDFLRSELY